MTTHSLFNFGIAPNGVIYDPNGSWHVRFCDGARWDDWCENMDAMGPILSALRAAGFRDASIIDTGGGVECVVFAVPQGEVYIGAFDEAGPNTALVSVMDADGCQIADAPTTCRATDVLATVRALVG